MELPAIHMLLITITTASRIKSRISMVTTSTARTTRSTTTLKSCLMIIVHTNLVRQFLMRIRTMCPRPRMRTVLCLKAGTLMLPATRPIRSLICLTAVSRFMPSGVRQSTVCSCIQTQVPSSQIRHLTGAMIPFRCRSALHTAVRSVHRPDEITRVISSSAGIWTKAIQKCIPTATS